MKQGSRCLQENWIFYLQTPILRRNGLRRTRWYSGRFPAKVVVSLLHPWAVRDQITQADLRESVFLKMNRSHKDYNVPEKESFYENVPCRQDLVASNFAATCALLEQGEAFAVFPMAFAYMEESKI